MRCGGFSDGLAIAFENLHFTIHLTVDAPSHPDRPDWLFSTAAPRSSHARNGH
jgi:hypothetical protein